MLPQLGEDGQKRLKKASVLVVGAGGLGSPALIYLAAAGVGTIGIVDFDTVDPSNLHRQIIFDSADVGRTKLDAARERLGKLNPLVNVRLHPFRLTSDNAMDLIGEYDLVLDGTDNFATRYLVNDACILTRTPNVFASIYRFDGQLSIFGDPAGPCYRCVFPEPPPPGSVPSCAEGGVLGVLPGILGTLQATEAIKYLTGIGESLVGRLLMVDALTMTFRNLQIKRDPECVICSERPTQTGLIDYELFCSGPGAHLTQDAPPSTPNHSDRMFFGPKIPSISVIELKKKMEASEDFLLLDVRQPEEATIADIGGVIIPMNDLPYRMDELSSFREKDIVVMCRSGARSASVVRWLQDQGFERVYNLDGGILAWSRQIDSTIPLY